MKEKFKKLQFRSSFVWAALMTVFVHLTSDEPLSLIKAIGIMGLYIIVYCAFSYMGDTLPLNTRLKLVRNISFIALLGFTSYIFYKITAHEFVGAFDLYIAGVTLLVFGIFEHLYKKYKDVKEL